jgi:hypothetical protein
VEMGGDWWRFRALVAEAFRRPRLIVMRIGLIVEINQLGWALVFRKKLIDCSLVIPSQIVEGAHHGGAISHALSQQVNGDKKRDGPGRPVGGYHTKCRVHQKASKESQP